LGIAPTTAHPAPAEWEKCDLNSKNHAKTNNKTKNQLYVEIKTMTEVNP